MRTFNLASQQNCNLSAFEHLHKINLLPLLLISLINCCVHQLCQCREKEELENKKEELKITVAQKEEELRLLKIEVGISFGMSFCANVLTFLLAYLIIRFTCTCKKIVLVCLFSVYSLIVIFLCYSEFVYFVPSG